MRHLRATTKREAVVAALVDFNRRRRLEKLASRLGTFERFPSAAEVEEVRARP
jgi:hypothetical protein